MRVVLLCLLVPFLPLLHAFVSPGSISISQDIPKLTTRSENIINDRPQKPSLYMIDKKRKAQLGIGDDEDEYDLYRALDVNTDKGGGDVCYLVYISYIFCDGTCLSYLLYHIYIILQYKGITKIVAGSFILVMIALLVVGLV